MRELRGATVAAAITEICTERITCLKKEGIVPTLAIIRVGARADDESYERGAEKRFAAAGAEIRKFILPEDATQEDLEKTVKEINEDDEIHGILMFRPLPSHMNEAKIKQLISMEKDVDGMSYAGLGGLIASKAGKIKAYAPCTPTAVIEVLDFYGIDVTGKKVAIVGRSAVVGLPLAVMLIQKNATVTVCHTKTKNLAEECRNADIIIAAVGRAKMIGKEHISEGQVLIDVGINFVDGKMCGDIDFEVAAEFASEITPVPGGVGAVTTSVLLKHTVNSALEYAEKNRKQ